MVRMVEVRRLTPNDAAQLWQLRLQRSSPNHAPFVKRLRAPRKPLSYFSDRLGATDTNGFVYGAFDDASLIGMAGYYRKDEERAWIWGVFVMPQYRGSRVSRASGSARTAIRTVPQINSYTFSRSARSNPGTARLLYRSCGFRLSGPDLDTPPNEEHLTYSLGSEKDVLQFIADRCQVRP